MQAIALIENNRENLSEVLNGYGGEYSICRFCSNENCDRQNKPKILKISEYIIGFVYDFVDNGLPAYPNSGGYDNQPFWFISLFHSGVNQLRKLRRENERKT
jgi:hypothetical protein